jgi:hypothetical protein
VNARTAVLLLCGLVAVGTLVRCGGSSPAQPPTQPSTPATTTTTTQPAGIVLPAGMTCSPTPPPLYGIKVKFHDQTVYGRWILDSKPLVMNVDDYCARVGTGGGTQKFCDTRVEGDPQRTACDYLAVGIADTGRWGPSWTYNGQPCASNGNCNNHPNNQFMAVAKDSGHFEACASTLAKIQPEEGTPCGFIDVKMAE